MNLFLIRNKGSCKTDLSRKVLLHVATQNEMQDKNPTYGLNKKCRNRYQVTDGGDSPQQAVSFFPK